MLVTNDITKYVLRFMAPFIYRGARQFQKKIKGIDTLNHRVELFVLVQGKLYTGRKEHKKYKSVE